MGSLACHCVHSSFSFMLFVLLLLLVCRKKLLFRVQCCLLLSSAGVIIKLQSERGDKNAGANVRVFGGWK